MPGKRATRPMVADRVVLASGLFARLADALDRNDFEQAAEARAELARLGYTVRARVGEQAPQAVLKPYTPRQQADGREVGHEG